MSISYEQAYSYAEILEILSFTHTSLVDKIPQKLMSTFKNHALSTYQYHLDQSVPLENQTISPETANLITLISLNYWCESQSEKDEIKEIILENEKEYNELKNKQYSYDNVFNKTQNSQTLQETKEPKKIEDISDNSDSNNLPVNTSSLPLYKKILLKIKNFFSKNK